MQSISVRAALLAVAASLAACGGDTGSEPAAGPPLNTDYSKLRIAKSTEQPLVRAANAEQVLSPLRNGLRLSLGGAAVAELPGVSAPLADAQGVYSGTTVQVEGVDEADAVKYDGTYIYAVRSAAVPSSISVPIPGLTRSVLKIVRTHPQSADFEVVSEFEIEGERSTAPLIYQLQSATGAAQYLAAVSQNYQGWLMVDPRPDATVLAIQPDRTTVQLLDVREPHNVSQAWQVELDGWLRASRKIGDILYLVNSYHPRLTGLVAPADTAEARNANERRIRGASASELLPQIRENGGAGRQLVAAGDCVIAAGLETDDAYSDLVVVTAIDLRERRVADVTCLSTNINGVYVSNNSLYVGGEGSSRPDGQVDFTVLHKFALDDGRITYRASGAVAGQIGWNNASYFMDEHAGDLRIVTTKDRWGGASVHQLSVLRPASGNVLGLLSVLPNGDHPAPIGKPGEQVFAVRFAAERAYVVTALRTDPLYVIDLSNAEDPVIGGELEIPGFATYLRPLGEAGTELVLSVGQQTSSEGRAQGVKVELFDVSDIAHPQSLGAQIFGNSGSFSEAVNDPHALAFVSLPDGGGERLALPVDVFDTSHPVDPAQFLWTY
ncbi:MAG TPA: beta-propeller domain-containing protein, partial [Povalibacter sp.]